MSRMMAHQRRILKRSGGSVVRTPRGTEDHCPACNGYNLNYWHEQDHNRG